MKNYPVALLSLLVLAGCAPGHDHSGDDHGHSHHGHAHEEVPTGPHGGRLLEAEGLTVELAIHEEGMPPEFRAWVQRAGRPVAPRDVQLSVTLTRLDGESTSYRFIPDGDLLRGLGVVPEPHSFEVTVRAAIGDRQYRWSYESFEGRVSIPAASALAAGIGTARAGPRQLDLSLPLHGRVIVDPEARRSLRARFPGLVREVTVSQGDRVSAGAMLARIEADESLQSYALTTPIAGVVTSRRVNPGEATGDGILFEVADVSARLIELAVLPRDQGSVRPGQAVRLRAVSGKQATQGTIVRVDAVPVGSTAVLHALVRFDGSQAQWMAGTPILAEVVMDDASREAGLAVPVSALQTFHDQPVVFERIGDTYEVRMPRLGRSDGEYVEVLDGLKPHAEIVTVNSYLIKADIEKSGAAHEH